ncbi:MAG: acVLRF1 family peptidyl-tRNA hydrolase [Propionibacteriaceae bacterium]
MTDRIVQIPDERVTTWIRNFSDRHGIPSYEPADTSLTLLAPDGAQARLLVPWLPWQPHRDPLAAFLEHLKTSRRFGVIIARKQAHAVGIIEGKTIIASTNDRHYVQGRTKAGGWSQQRYARRRENQAKAAFQDAADDVVNLLLPAIDALDWLVTGGEQQAIQAVLADPRLQRQLADLRQKSPQRVWPMPDPRRATLLDFATIFQSIPIELNNLC